MTEKRKRTLRLLASYGMWYDSSGDVCMIRDLSDRHLKNIIVKMDINPDWRSMYALQIRSEAIARGFIREVVQKVVQKK